MSVYDLLLVGATVVDPFSGKDLKLDIGVQDGRIHPVEDGGKRDAAKILDVGGCMICPGFVDTHMHDEEIDDPDTTQLALLRQGVTTCIAGNCGSGPLQDDVRPSRSKPWLNIGYMTGHSVLRNKVGMVEADRYRPATESEIEGMKILLLEELRKGSFGLSFGLEYNPGTGRAEIMELSKVVKGFERRWVSSHIRHDGSLCLEAVREMVDLAEDAGVRVQLSHLGSMTAFGFAAEALDILYEGLEKGFDLTWDSYPYGAFCTRLGSAVFDPGFEERFDKTIDALEVGSGPHAGKRLDRDLFEQLRRDCPQTLIIAHVMNEDEMKLILRDRLCAIGSDALLLNGGGHPRAAGAFPRGINWLREGGMSWNRAISHATSIPAGMCWLDAGRIKEGVPADLVVFDPDTFGDRATFGEPLLPPEGIKYVIVNGKIAVEDGVAGKEPCGRFMVRD